MIKENKMETKDFNMETDKMDEIDLQELARLVKEGYTSGWLDNGEGKHIYWELKVDVWED